jgi:hypothetical protein
VSPALNLAAQLDAQSLGTDADLPGEAAKPAPKTTPKPVPTRAGRPGRARRPAEAPAPAPEPAGPAEPAWLERLPPAQRADARRLLALLDEVGIDDPTLVRRELEANLPEIATVLLSAAVRTQALDIWRDPDGLTDEIRSVASAATGPTDSVQ